MESTTNITVTQRKKNAYEETQQKLGAEMHNYLDLRWKNHRINGGAIHPINSDILDCFKKAAIAIAPEHIGVISYDLSRVDETKSDDLTLRHVQIMILVFTKAAPKAYSSSLKDYLKKKKEIDSISIIYQQLIEAKNEQLRQREREYLSEYSTNTWLRKAINN